MPHETAAISVQVLCTPHNHAPVYSDQCHFIRNCIHRMHVCLAVTCHLHFRQNNQDVLHAVVVTEGWNGYQNKSPHRKLALLGLEPETFQSQLHHSTTEPSLLIAPHTWVHGMNVNGMRDWAEDIFEISCSTVCRSESLTHFKGMGGMNVTNIRRETQ